MPDLRRRLARDGRVWTPAVLLLLACLLLSDRLPFRSPLRPAPPVPSWATDASTVRRAKGSPEYELGPYPFGCNECHRMWPAPQAVRMKHLFHDEIQLRHGLCDDCLACHHEGNRDAFVGLSGEEIPWSRPELLCARCHGTVYRDWQHGVHGRTNGYWDAQRGPQRRHVCTDCHDPHDPPFPPLHSAPGPHTLRLAPEDQLIPRHEFYDPLHLSESGVHAAGAGAPREHGR